jgi:hypothetical protein
MSESSEELIDFHRIVQTPASRLVEEAYRTFLNREPSIAEHAYHLERLNRGCSRKLFLLSICYSPEGQRHPHCRTLRGGRLLSLFNRLAAGRPRRAHVLIKLLHYLEVMSGRARRHAAAFQAEWRICAMQDVQAQIQAVREDSRILQQDLQRRIDLFLLEARQSIDGEILTPRQKASWLERLERAKTALSER